MIFNALASHLNLPPNIGLILAVSESFPVSPHSKRPHYELVCLISRFEPFKMLQKVVEN